MATPNSGAPADLRGFRVGVTADRRAEEQAVLFRRLGVDVVIGSAMQTLPTPAGGDRLRAQVADLVAAPPDYLVANTGIGVRHLFELAEEWGLGDDLRRALSGVRLVARGPKAAGALRSAGSKVWWRAPGEQLAEVRDHLLAEGMEGARVVFQLHGDDRQGLSGALREAGAEVTEIEVYRWSLPADASAVAALVDACCGGQVDAVTFTAAPAVRNLLDLADAGGRAGALLDVLEHEMVIGCVGPVCAAAAEAEGLTSSVVPDHWRLGSLVKRVGQALAARRRLLSVPGPRGPVEVWVQGSLLVVGGVEAQLGPLERGIARVLADRPGAPIGPAELGRRIRPLTPADPAAVAEAVALLRSHLGEADTSLEESEGGYRWMAERMTPPDLDAVGPSPGDGAPDDASSEDPVRRGGSVPASPAG